MHMSEAQIDSEKIIVEKREACVQTEWSMEQCLEYQQFLAMWQMQMWSGLSFYLWKWWFGDDKPSITFIFEWKKKDLVLGGQEGKYFEFW